MNKVLTKIFGDPNVKILKILKSDAQKVNQFEDEISKLTDDQLKDKTQEFKKRLESGATLDEIGHEAFAVVRESAKRTLGQRHYDVQIMGGMALHRGMIAEMRTGEGKTLTSTSAIYLNALEGKGVHVVTVNDYLAKRDMVWMGQIFYKLGLMVGCIQQEGGYLYDEDFKAQTEEEKALEDQERDTTGSFKVQMDFLRPAQRADAYTADITYGTNNQFGFDYLRDNMAMDLKQKVQRPLNYAIVDEVDSILIDEARTPLIISAPAEESADLYYKFAQIVLGLQENVDYNLDEKLRVATFLEEGMKKIEQRLGIDNLYGGGLELVHHAEQALKAHALFRKDKDYVVMDGEVKIVDEFTGRILEGRRYSEGLHQAIEAKEGVQIKNESRTLATITFQNYFRMYKKLAGMTGTAETEAEEFSKIYNLDVAVIPTNKPIDRKDLVDKIFKTEKGKFLAVVEEVKRLREIGQPILIGTASIEKNELLDELLMKSGVPHETLNAKNHEREAQIIAQAGKKGSVTLATNMAGRGVDIILGGNPSTKDDQNNVKELGGLHVIGTERHDARRIDNQLRGRSGRQGDPGSTQFFVSLEDDLMRIFASDRVRKMMDTFNIDEKTPIESKMISKSIEKAQERVEGHHFDTRKHVLEYDDVLNRHRMHVYNWRDRVLENAKGSEEAILEMIEEEVERVIFFHTEPKSKVEIPDQFKDESSQQKGKEANWDPKEIIESLTTILPVTPDFVQIVNGEFKEREKDQQLLAQKRTIVIEAFMAVASDKVKMLKDHIASEEKFHKLLCNVMLRANDNLWVAHLDTMSYLRRSVGLQGYGQRDPLVEYKREAFGLFQEFQADVAREVVYNIFKVIEQSVAVEQIIAGAPSLFEKAGLTFSGAQKTMVKKAAEALLKGVAQSAVRAIPKVGRNEECPCGSGKKYKKCHGA
ncbi:preprotein translocase subunit SecA [Patescibacteria group bacterium]|nr:preprotein translocase subunit SecA [Patescibacteria group bacterium]MBU4453262.1 preprotein translocase subunit SecA [Patescibacteria group bacterium]MCG2687728.1 preprotein translocase subunit SecA [Candidatus Parcubacteria bacterium]